MTELYRDPSGGDDESRIIDEISHLQFGDSPAYVSVRKDLYEKRAQPHINMYEVSLAALGLSGHERVVDLGCGSGDFVEYVARNGHSGEIIGVNDSANTFYATKRILEGDGFKNVRFVRSDVRDLRFPKKGPFPKNFADAVTAHYLLYHVAEPDLVLEQVQKILKAGGLFSAAVRGDYNMIRMWESAGWVARDQGYQAPETYYTNFDAEDAIERLSKYFTVLPELSLPSYDPNVERSHRSILRPMRLGAEDWFEYSYSMAAIISSSVKAEHPGQDLPRDTDSKIRLAVEEKIKPIYFNEIKRTGFFYEVAQDILVVCRNDKLAASS